MLGKALVSECDEGGVHGIKTKLYEGYISNRSMVQKVPHFKKQIESKVLKYNNYDDLCCFSNSNFIPHYNPSLIPSLIP